MDRFARLCHWLADLGIAAEPRPASADASFRRYWRVALPEGGTRIVMDAPPEKSRSPPGSPYSVCCTGPASPCRASNRLTRPKDSC